MSHPISALGAFHTALSVIPLVAGLAAFERDGKIIPSSVLGKVYWGGMAASVVTAFGLSSTGGFNPGHALGILALVVMAIATLAPRFLGRVGAYVQVALMSFSFFLLMVPGTNETLSRLPVGHPIGNGPDSPPVQLALGVVFVVFFVGTVYQLVQLRRRRAAAA